MIQAEREEPVKEAVKEPVEETAIVEPLADIAKDLDIEGAFNERAAELRAKHRKVEDDADAFLKDEEAFANISDTYANE